jgi:hypothetical protein
MEIRGIFHELRSRATQNFDGQFKSIFGGNPSGAHQGVDQLCTVRARGRLDLPNRPCCTSMSTDRISGSGSEPSSRQRGLRAGLSQIPGPAAPRRSLRLKWVLDAKDGDEGRKRYVARLLSPEAPYDGRLQRRPLRLHPGDLDQRIGDHEHSGDPQRGQRSPVHGRGRAGLRLCRSTRLRPA